MLYTFPDGHTYRKHLLELETATPGLTLYSVTFASKQPDPAFFVVVGVKPSTAFAR